jgi:transcriptional regulator with XRE-family HTH domain
MLPLELGDSRLPLLLKRAGISQIEIAELLGVSPSFINQVIKGRRTFSLLQSFRAAVILKCSIDDLHTNTRKTLGDRRFE